MRKVTAIILLVFILFALLLTGCRQKYTKFSNSFFDCFDTYTTVVGFTKTEKEFDRYFQQFEKRFQELHKLFDKYNDYEGLNNIKTINDNAGIKPVKVKQEIIDLILFSKEWYQKAGGKTNIAMGPVIEVWHQYFEDASYDPIHTKIPTMEELKAAADHTDIDQVIVDTKNSTVFLAEQGMSLDVGAVAKGFATEIVVDELMKAGFQSGILSPGGNIRTIGKPLDGIREKWGIGIQDPDKPVVNDRDNTLDTIYVNDASVVSSGDYQRYYIHEGKVIHHIIDPDTLMPGENFRAITVVADDAGVADFLSTTFFLLTYEEGLALLEGLDNVEAYWVLPDKSVRMTKGMEAVLRSQGATGGRSK
jgi:thiamine biosynthesis lipoprotein